MLTEEEIAAIKERCRKATPPPWRGTYTEWTLKDDYGDDPYRECFLLFTHGMVDPERPVGGTSDRSCAYFIADCRTDVPFLVEVLEALRQSPSVAPTIKELNRIYSIWTTQYYHIPYGAWRVAPPYPGEGPDAKPRILSLPGRAVAWLYPDRYIDPEARQWNADAHFIAHARGDIPRLVRAILQLTPDLEMPSSMYFWWRSRESY